jgi:hypothetical protein
MSLQQTQTAPAIGISFADLLRYNESEALKWRAWLETQSPDLLDVPFGNPAQRMGNVREMLWHVFITEWVYACVLNGESFDRWDQFKRESIADLFAIGEDARAGLEEVSRRRHRSLGGWHGHAVRPGVHGQRHRAEIRDARVRPQSAPLGPARNGSPAARSRNRLAA